MLSKTLSLFFDLSTAQDLPVAPVCVHTAAVSSVLTTSAINVDRIFARGL